MTLDAIIDVSGRLARQGYLPKQASRATCSFDWLMRKETTSSVSVLGHEIFLLIFLN